MFVVINAMNDDPITYGFLEVIIPTKDSILTKSDHKIKLRFPKCFKMLAVFESSNKVTNEAMAKRMPTYFSEIIRIKKVEFTYAESAICKEKRNESTYILLIFVNFDIVFRYLIILV